MVSLLAVALWGSACLACFILLHRAGLAGWRVSLALALSGPILGLSLIWVRDGVSLLPLLIGCLAIGYAPLAGQSLRTRRVPKRPSSTRPPLF